MNIKEPVENKKLPQQSFPQPLHEMQTMNFTEKNVITRNYTVNDAITSIFSSRLYRIEHLCTWQQRTDVENVAGFFSMQKVTVCFV